MDYSLIMQNGLLTSLQKPLVDIEVFPLSTLAKKPSKKIKKDLGDVTLMSIDEDQSFVVETDDSNVAIYATLNQNRKQVVFFSTTLNKSQKSSLLLKKKVCLFLRR